MQVIDSVLRYIRPEDRRLAGQMGIIRRCVYTLSIGSAPRTGLGVWERASPIPAIRSMSGGGVGFPRDH